ncbi:MAG: glycosyltransferase family 4 protein [Flavobacteriales bacterium]
MKASSQKQLLHIVNWYPNQVNEKEGLWIREHIKALEPFFHNRVAHIEVKPGKGFRRKRALSDAVMSYSYEVPVRSWFLIEFLTTALLIFVLVFRCRLGRFSLINFHIAYPLCTYLHRIKRVIGLPCLITEHWSAYHFGFHTDKRSGIRRIGNIFRKNDVGVITVSEALKKDIEGFTGQSIRAYVLPNALPFRDLSPPKASLEKAKGPSFFMLGQWKDPKRPLLALRAFLRFYSDDPSARLRIGGYGPQVEEIRNFIHENEREGNMAYMGEMEKEEILEALHRADGFLHPSDYETFSVVCVEALSQGVPVIASEKGGIPEYLDEENGILIPRNDVEHWVKGLEAFDQKRANAFFDPPRIANNARERFGRKRIGGRYQQLIEQEIVRFYR